MRQQLPAQTRELFDSYAASHAESFGVEEVQRDDVMHERLAVRMRVLELLLEENCIDWTLTTEGYPIYAKPFGKSVFKRSIRAGLQEDHPTTELFERHAVAFFDGNGIKAMSMCVGYDAVANYLRTVARIFTDPKGPTKAWLEEQGISATAMSVGGDEFALLLCAKESISSQLMQEIITRYQEEISVSSELRNALNFDDRSVLINLGYPTKETRAEFELLSADEQAQKLHELRSTLPDAFIPSFSGGGVTLDEIIASGAVTVEKPNETFDTLREEMFDTIMQVAEGRQAQDKEHLKSRLLATDPKTYQFLLRTPNDRLLLAEISRLRGLLGVQERGAD
jgi:GGDEF domain-containing protein